ncbi:MAG: PQQ-binding-like beta-propeller repeat protein [Phycisphaerales bacterium]
MIRSASRRCADLVRTRLSLALAIGLGVSGLMTACASDPAPPRRDDAYMMTIDQANDLDYQIAWQSAVAVAANGGVNAIYPYDDIVVTSENGRNILSALTTRDGSRAWDAAIGAPLERLLGVRRQGDRLYATTQSDFYALDSATGRLEQHDRFAANYAAGTRPIIRGEYAIYGTSDGRVVYHHIPTGIAKDAYRFEAPIDIDVAPVGDAVAVLTRDASVNLHNPIANSRMWRNNTLDPAVVTPAVGPLALYVVSPDQSVWAFRLSDGREIWRFRAQRPLRDEPKYLDGRVYVAVPGQGLVALDEATGEVIWTTDEINGGTLLTRKNGDLIVFDADDAPGSRGGRFYRVDERTGDLLGTARTPRISLAVADTMQNGSIFGASYDGRLLKLVP